jgi:hypothetical protein
MRRVVWLTVLGVTTVGGLMGWSGEALAASAVQAKLSQQVAGGGVTVIATLLKEQADATAIKLVLDTHSVNLDGYKLDAIAALRDDAGKTYPVVAVEQASGGGHHRQAVLQFGKVSAEAKTIELVVRDVAGVEERIFRWSTGE